MTQDDLIIADPKMRAQGVDVFYGDKQAINNVSIDVGTDLVTAFIGPSGCGKSTFLRSLNRMNDTVASAKVTGRIELDGEDIYAPSMDVVQLRARVGMVFQKPNPFPKSIYDNVGYGPRIHGLAPSKPTSMSSSNARWCAPACGTRSRTACSKAAPRCRAASNSGCASRAPSRSTPK